MTSTSIDELVTAKVFEALAPAQLNIALQAVEQLEQERQSLHHQWQQQLEQARYEVQLAQLQYDAVDPLNRLVAAELEQRWNDRLEALHMLEHAYAEAQRQAHFSVSGEEKKALQRLAADLPALWQAPTTTDAERKRLLRYVIAEVQLDGVTTPGKIAIQIIWQSGAVTDHQIDRIRVGCWAPRTDQAVVERIRALAPTHTVAEIVKQLNREGLRSAHGRRFRDHHVWYLGRCHHIEITACPARLRQPRKAPGTRQVGSPHRRSAKRSGARV